MRRPIRSKTGSPSSSSRIRIWRLIADCETCSFSPAAVNDPVSAIARMISSCLRSMRQHTSLMAHQDVNAVEEREAKSRAVGCEARREGNYWPPRYEHSGHVRDATAPGRLYEAR